ncbi:unnamed protein product [Urochloa humidicola]
MTFAAIPRWPGYCEELATALLLVGRGGTSILDAARYCGGRISYQLQSTAIEASAISSGAKGQRQRIKIDPNHLPGNNMGSVYARRHCISSAPED